MSVVSTDRSWEQNLGEVSEGPILYKVVNIQDLSFYIGKDVFNESAVFEEDILNIVNSENNQRYKLFGPFSATLQAKLRNPMEDMKEDQPIPNAVLYLCVHNFDCSLDRLQYISMMKLLEAFSQKTTKPENAIEKWKWIVEQIFPGLGQRIKQEKNLQVEAMKLRRLRMLEYFDNTKGIMYPKRLEELEDVLELDDILLYRSIIDEKLNSITVPINTLSQNDEVNSNKSDTTSNVGWLQWMSSYFTSKQEEPKHSVSSSDNSLKTAEEGPGDVFPVDDKASLQYSISDFADSNNNVHDCSLFRVDVVIEKAVFLVCDNGLEEEKQPFARMLLGGLSFGFEKRFSGTIRLDLLFNYFSIVDCRNQGGSMLISRKCREEESSSLSSKVDVVEYTLRDQVDFLLQDPFGRVEETSKGVLGVFKIEMGEQDESNGVYGRFGGIQISLIDQSFFKTLFGVFELPRKKTNLIESVSVRAKKSLSELREYLESRLYERKKRFQMKILIEGPSIFLSSSKRGDGVWFNFDTLKLKNCSHEALESNQMIVYKSIQDMSSLFGFYQLELNDLDIKYIETISESDATCIVVLKLERAILYFVTLLDAITASSCNELPLFIKNCHYRPLACLVGELPALNFHIVPQFCMFFKELLQDGWFMEYSKYRQTEQLETHPTIDRAVSSSLEVVEEASTDRRIEHLTYFTLQLMMPQINVSIGSRQGNVGLKASLFELTLCLSFLFDKKQFSCSFERFLLKQLFSRQQPQNLFICEDQVRYAKNYGALCIDANFHPNPAEDRVHVRIISIKMILEPSVYADIGRMGYDELFSKHRGRTTFDNLDDFKKQDKVVESEMLFPKRKVSVDFVFEELTFEIERNRLPFAILTISQLGGNLNHEDTIGFQGQGIFDNITLYNMSTELEVSKKVLNVPISDCRGRWKLGSLVTAVNLEDSQSFVDIPELQITTNDFHLIFLSSFWTELKAQVTKTMENLFPSNGSERSGTGKEYPKYAPFLLWLISNIFELDIPRSSSCKDAVRLKAENLHLKNKLQMAVNYNIGLSITTGSVDGMLYQMTVESEIPSKKEAFCESFLLDAVLEFDIDTASCYDWTSSDTTEPPPDVFIRMKSIRHTMFHVSEVQYTTLCHILYGNLSEDIEKENIANLICRRKSEDSELSSSPENMLPGEWLLPRRSPSKIPVGYRAILEFPQLSLSLFSGGFDNHSHYAIADIDFHRMIFFIDYYDDGRLSVEASAIHATMLDTRPCSLYRTTLVMPDRELQKDNQPLLVMKYYGWPEAASVYSFSFSSLKFFVVADFIRSIYRLSIPFTNAHYDPWLLRPESWEESTRVFDQPYYDSHALVLGGDLVSKYDISSEESGVYHFIGKNMHVLLGSISEPNLLKALYPFELTIDYSFGSDLRVLRVNVDSILCRLGIHDAPIVFSVIWRLFVADAEQLSTKRDKCISDDVLVGEDHHLCEAEASKIPIDFQCNVQGIRLIALEESRNSCVPVLEARVDRLRGTFRDFLCGQVKLEVAVFLFYEKKGWWEPVLERWPCNLNFSIGSKNTLVLELLSEHRLNINSTQVAVEGVLKAVESFRHLIQHIQQTDLYCTRTEYMISKDRPSVAAFVVHNALGVPISLTFPYDSSRYVCWEGEEKEVDIRTDELIRALTAVSSQDTDINQLEFINSCTVQVPGYDVLTLSASEYGVHLVSLHSVDANAAQSSSNLVVDEDNQPYIMKDTIAVWDVSMKDGCPYCTLRSRYRLLNKTSIKVEVTYGRNLQMYSILPGEAWSPPLGFEYEPIYLRPCINGGIHFDGEELANECEKRIFSWSSALESFHEFWKKAMLVTREERKMSRKWGFDNYSAEDFMRHMDKFISLVCCVSDLEDSNAANTCLDEFYFLLFPRVDEKRPFGWENGWLDLEIHPPLTIQNGLPREVAFRLRKPKGRVSRIFHSVEEESFGFVEGILEPLQTAEVFSLSHEIGENTLSLRYDNLSRPCRGKPNYEGFMKRADTPDWGQSVVLHPNNRVELFSFSGSESFLPRGLNLRSQKVFARLELTDDDRRVGHHFRIVAEYWLRNKSSSAINVRVVSNDAISFFSLAPCPPGEPVDPFVVFDGNEIAFAVAGYDNYIPLMEPLANVDKPLELNLQQGNYILDVRPGKGSFGQSLVATIRDCLRIENSTKFLFQWCQSHSMKTIHDIPPGKFVAVHWDFNDKERLLSLRRTEDRYSREWQWSRPLNPDYHGDVFLKMYSPKRHEQYIPVVRIQTPIGGSKKIVILEEDRRYPPYQIVNLCRTRAIAFHQVGTSQDFPPWLVRPGRTSRYAWDDPCGMECKKKLLAVEVVETSSESRSMSNVNGSEMTAMRYPEFNISIDIVSRKFNKQVLPKGPALLYAVTVNGPTKVVTFVDDGSVDIDDPLAALAKITFAATKFISTPSTGDALCSLGEDLNARPQQEATAISSNQVVVAKKEEENVNRAWHFSIALDAVGISFIDSTPTELAYLTLTNVHFDYQKTEDYQVYDLSIGDLQLDNQLPNAPWPVIAWPSERRSTSEASDNSVSVPDNTNNKPFFQITIEKSPKTFPGIQAFTGVYFAFQRLNISLDEYFLRRCWPFLQVLLRLDSSSQEECLQGEDEEDREDRDQNMDSNSLVFRERLYIEWLLFGPVQLIVSFSSAPSTTTRYGAYRRLIRVLLATVGNVEGAEFRFNALELHHVFDTESHLRGLIGEYYITQVLGQRLKLISSNSLLGNPAALFDSIALGAKDFFVEPSKAVGGRDFIIRLDRGSRSLVTNTVGGLLNSINQIPRSLSVGLATAVGNREYLAEREMKRSRQPTSAVDGFVQGAKYFGEGISKGVSGVFRDPYQGLKREGASGFFKGLGKGLVGGLVHPMTGVLDFIAEPAAGLRSMTVGGLQQGALPMRPPRAIGTVKQLQCYDVHAATGKAILQAVIRSGDEDHEELLYWIELDNLFQYTPSKATTDEKSPEWQLAAIVTLFTRSGRRGKTLGKELLAVKVQEALNQGRTVPVSSNFRGRAALLTSRRLMITTFDGKVLWQRKLRHIVDARMTSSVRGTPALAICVLSSRTQQGFLWERIDCPSSSAVESLRKVILRNIRFVNSASSPLQYTTTSSRDSSSAYKGSESDEEGSISGRQSDVGESLQDTEQETSSDMLGDIFHQVPFLDENISSETTSVTRGSHQDSVSCQGTSQPLGGLYQPSHPSKSVDDVIQREIDRCVSFPSNRNQNGKRSLRLVIANALEGPLHLVDANLISGIWCQEPTSVIPNGSARLCELECGKGFMKGIEGSLVFVFHCSSTETPCWLTIRFVHTFFTSSKLNVKVPVGIRYRVVEGASEHSSCIIIFTHDNFDTTKVLNNSVSIAPEERTKCNTSSYSMNRNDSNVVVSDDAVVELASMGFDPEKAYQVLQLTNSNISDAVQMLLEWDNS
ncbi:Putative vacuolar protein sorting-associated protein 13C [Galdieria sulphuraria]|nr:Putative vacuolar protein sorting-associated protein 13C [Galdieria sulphuraria]